MRPLAEKVSKLGTALLLSVMLSGSLSASAFLLASPAPAQGKAAATTADKPVSGATGKAAAIPEFARARSAATTILARREFQAAAGPSWWDVQLARFWSWVGRVLFGVGALGKLAPWLGTAMEWTLFVGAAVGLLLFARRSFVRQRLRVRFAAGEGLSSGKAWSHQAEDWARMAEQRAAAREWREAVHCLYWEAIVLLEGRRAWRHNASRTPREYVRLLQPGTAQRETLRGLTGLLERTWYGLREAQEADFLRARAMFEQLQTGAATRAAATGRDGDPGSAALVEGA